MTNGILYPVPKLHTAAAAAAVAVLVLAVGREAVVDQRRLGGQIKIPDPRHSPNVTWNSVSSNHAVVPQGAIVTCRPLGCGI